MSDFNYIDSFPKKSQISNFIKIRPVEAELFDGERLTGGRTEGQTVKRKLIVALRGLTKAPKKKLLVKILHWEAVSQSSTYYIYCEHIKAKH
jgi:hypothetical protein